MGNGTESGMFVRKKQKLFLSVHVDDIEMAGRTEYGSYVEEIDEES